MRHAGHRIDDGFDPPGEMAPVGLLIETADGWKVLLGTRALFRQLVDAVARRGPPVGAGADRRRQPHPRLAGARRRWDRGAHASLVEPLQLLLDRTNEAAAHRGLAELEHRPVGGL